ncbi:MAG: AAA family ATPase [Rubripirellula sp.]
MNLASDRTSAELTSALRRADTYPHQVASSVTVYETHVSWVFLAGDFAYKVKKPLVTHFLDYSTLDQRRRYCEEEVRLDSRYASDLYLGVVPVTKVRGQYQIGGDGEVVEYAVKMKRFAEGSLLSELLEAGRLPLSDVMGLAVTVAGFHHDAQVADRSAPWGSPHSVLENALDNVRDLETFAESESFATKLATIGEWTHQFFEKHQLRFSQRRVGGFIRECHGDLHASNIVQWHDRLVPFDGIEFNDAFRWIDVLSDAAFLGMDLKFRGRPDLSHSFLNSYLEQTGDHASLPILRWYMVYRAMVRAKVAAIISSQHPTQSTQHIDALQDCRKHLDHARLHIQSPPPRLWITHGVSGSGKTYGSEATVQRHAAIRLRSDVERKRHFGLQPDQRPSEQMKRKLYCESANRATYNRLERLTRGILRAGYSVVVDATFLRQSMRDQFAQLAQRESVNFHILDFDAKESTLRKRVIDRNQNDNDASDADVAVLESQLRTREPLTPAELNYVDAPTNFQPDPNEAS